MTESPSMSGTCVARTVLGEQESEPLRTSEPSRPAALGTLPPRALLPRSMPPRALLPGALPPRSLPPRAPLPLAKVKVLLLLSALSPLPCVLLLRSLSLSTTESNLQSL